MADLAENKILLIILSILIPPLAVGLKVGFTKHFWINIILLLLTFGIGAVIHSLIVVLR
ncbi:MAG: YqaE/Pmp3 family membrane protein [Phycisphaerales bacterium]